MATAKTVGVKVGRGSMRVLGGVGYLALRGCYALGDFGEGLVEGGEVGLAEATAKHEAVVAASRAKKLAALEAHKASLVATPMVAA